MDSISIQTLEWNGQVIFLEAEPGQYRRDCLEKWLNEARLNGATTWLLSCDREQDGPWAGVKDIFSDLVPKIQAQAPDLITKHDFELVNILPSLQKTITIRYMTLAHSVPLHERVRHYPADRAYRIVHGLIDLLAAWYQLSSNNAPWVIACDRYDRAGTLAIQFFVELMRRRGQQINLTLLLATDPGASETTAEQFDSKYWGQSIRLELPPELPTALVSKKDMARLAQELEQQIGEDEIELELHLPQLIHLWLLSDQPEKAMNYQIEACSICTRRNFYEDGSTYGEAALKQLERYCPEDLQKRQTIYFNLFTCYAVLDRPQQTLQIVEAAMTKLAATEDLFYCYYMMAMLYARFLPELDLAKAEACLEIGLEELARTNLPNHIKLFHTAFNRNGLALIRHRQGRSQEAVELCRWCSEQLNAHLKPDEHRLHRSVLLYNIAQVYGSIGVYDQAIAFFADAIAIDPNYSEYYNDLATIFVKMERWEDALNNFLKAIELSPPYPDVWTNLGQCYRRMDQMAEAIDAYSKALDLKPNHLTALLGRAQAFEMLEQHDAALADYNAALKLNPHQPLVLANRATLHYETERYQEALSDLNEAIALTPENSDLYQNRAVALTVLQRFQEATQDLKIYLQLNPLAEDRAEVESKLLALQSGIAN